MLQAAGLHVIKSYVRAFHSWQWPPGTVHMGLVSCLQVGGDLFWSMCWLLKCGVSDLSPAMLRQALMERGKQ